MFSKLTSDGRATITRHPFRIKEVNDEIEMMGAKVVEQYATFGPYDFITIIEVPGNETIAKTSIEIGSRGSVQIATSPAIPVREFIRKIG